MVLTDQTVWPMLEFKYPFLNNVEFDSIWEPNGMFYQTILNAGDMQMYLISGSQNFHPFYLLPVPDFFLTSKPVLEEPEEAVFQSYSSLQRMFLPRTYWGSSVQEEADGTPQVIPLDTINYSQTFGFKVKFTVAYTNGPGSGYYARIGLGRDLPTDFGFGFEGPNMSSTLLGMTSGRLNNPTDNTNTSLELEFEGVSQQQTGFEPLKLFIVLINASPDTEKLLFNYVVELRSIGSITCLSSFQTNADTLGVVGISNYPGISSSLPVEVTSIPPFTLEGPFPIPVSFEQDVPVTIRGSVPVYSGPAPELEPVVPLWTTLYDPYK